MATLNEVREKIEFIRNSDFDIYEIDYYGEKHKISKLLRKDQLYSNAIHYIKGISNNEKEALSTELDEIMKNKIRNLNPNFDEKTINNIIFPYKWDNVDPLMDIFVIDDIVIQKRATLTESGNIHEINTFIPGDQIPYNIQLILFIHRLDPYLDV